ncbi:hypothetical protein HDU96_006824 [Phlyctochytrium bullatum]|nr:hypothetical protein HDU96_006824 [Phlyctochytrium bullatum]
MHSVSDNGVEASPALRKRQAVGNLFQNFTIAGSINAPLASEQVYNLLPDACKPLLVSYTGVYATQDDLSKCLALVKKSSIGHDAYLYVKNHTDLIATLPWQESVSKTSYNTTLAKLKEVADQADSLPSNSWRKFLTSMDQALYPASIPMQVKLRFNTQFSGNYIMMQPVALAARPGKGEVFAAALTQSLLSNSNLNGKEAIKFFNSRSPTADVESYVGWVVDSINGKNPTSYLQYESVSFTYDAKDSGTFDPFLATMAASRTALAYVLRNPATNVTVTHTFPWLVWPYRGFEWRLGETLLRALDIPIPSVTKKELFSGSSTGAFATSSSAAFPTATAIPVATASTTLPSPAATSVPSNATAASSSRVARRQIISITDPEAFTKVSTSLSYLLPPAAARIGPNVYQVDQQTLARMDAAIETAVKSNPNIKNVILDLTQWAVDNEMLALAYYFFGSSVKPLEYAFRLTPLVEAILKGFAASENSDGYQFDGMFPVFNTSQHASPSASLSSATFDINSRLTLPTTNIIAQAKNITVNGSPVRVSGLTILTMAESCGGKCEEFVRIARTQFKIRTVTLGLDVNGVVSAPNSSTYTPFADLASLYERDFFSKFVETQLALLANPLAVPSTTSTDPRLAPVISAAKEVATLLPAGFTTDRFGYQPANPYRVHISIPPVLVYDAGASDDAMPLGLANATEADMTLKDVWAFDWPMGVWKVAVNTPAQNVATLKHGTASTGGNGAGTSTATVTGTGGKSAGFAMRASFGLMVGMVGLAAAWEL